MDDQGIFIPIIGRNDAHDPEAHPQIEGLSSEIASPHLGQKPSGRGALHGFSKEFSADPFPPVSGEHGKGDDVPIRGKDDISQNPFLPFRAGSHIDEELLGEEGVEMEKGPPIIGGFGKGLAFDVEDGAEVCRGEGPDHRICLIPERMETIPPVRERAEISVRPEAPISV